MALNKQLITLPVDNGLDTKLDDKQAALGFLRKAENVVFETLKLLRKRNGYDLVSNQLLGGGNLDNIEIVTKLQNELLAIKDKGLYSFSDSLNQWTQKGTIYSVDTRSFITLKNAEAQLHISSAKVDNFLITTWESSLGGVYYSVQDINNRSFLISNALVSTTGERPKVESISNKVFIIYIDGTDLKFKNFLISTPNSLSSEFTTITNVDTTSKILDTYVNAGRIVVGYNSSTVGAELGLFSIKVDDTFTSALNFTGESASNAITVFEDSASRILVAWSDGTEVKYLVYSSGFNIAILLPTVVETIADVVNMTFAETGNALYRLYYEVEQTGVLDNYVKQANLDTLGNVTGVQDFCRSVGLAAKTAKYENKVLVPVVLESEQQASYFLLDEDNIIITKFANQTATGVIFSGRLPSTLVLDSERILIPNNIKSRTSTDNGVFFSVPGAAYTIIDFDPEIKYQRAQLADVLHICSGVLKMYDGSSVVEHGFHVYPEVLLPSTTPIAITVTTTQVGVIGVTDEIQTITFAQEPGSGSFTLTYGTETTAPIAWNESNANIKAIIEALTYITGTVTVTGDFSVGLTITYDNSMGDVDQPTATSSLQTPLTGGNMSDGDYAYVALYRWTDNTGKDHRSSPTLLPLEVTLSGGTSTQTQDVDVPTLHLTEKSDVVIELYRTEDAGETYYKVDEILNNKSVDYVTIQDTLSDLDLISKELLYTTGDVLENIAAPPCHLVTVFNNRLAVVGDDRNRVYLSKDTIEGQPVEFTDIIYRNVSESYGDVTCLKAIGEKLVIFTKDAQFFIAGDGPNNTGTQDTLTLPDIISTDIGCLSPDAAILTPSGIVFQSRKGIWLLSGGMGLEYAGARVEEYNRDRVTAVDIVGELNQIRFLLEDERALVYNYNLDKWATFENHGGLSSTVIENDYYYVREDGALYKENRSTFSDASSPISMKLETGWINFSDAQSYLRVYSMMILMTYKTPHKLKVKVAYDYKNAWVQEEIINPLDFIDPAIYGTQSPYGSGSPYGGDGGLYQIRVDFKIQKCQSIKISIEDDQDVIGEGLSISALLFKVGMKGTEGKIGVTNKYGVK